MSECSPQSRDTQDPLFQGDPYNTQAKLNQQMILMKDTQLTGLYCNHHQVQEVHSVDKELPVSWTLSSYEVTWFYKIHCHHLSSVLSISLNTQASFWALIFWQKHLFRAFALAVPSIRKTSLHPPTLLWGLLSNVTFLANLDWTPTIKPGTVSLKLFLFCSYHLSPSDGYLIFK